jgi:hypothetical protein
MLILPHPVIQTNTLALAAKRLSVPPPITQGGTTGGTVNPGLTSDHRMHGYNGQLAVFAVSSPQGAARLAQVGFPGTHSASRKGGLVKGLPML